MQGNFDPLAGSTGKKETAKEAAARVQQDEEDARDAVGYAFEAGCQGLVHDGESFSGS